MQIISITAIKMFEKLTETIIEAEMHKNEEKAMERRYNANRLHTQTYKQ